MPEFKDINENVNSRENFSPNRVKTSQNTDSKIREKAKQVTNIIKTVVPLAVEKAETTFLSVMDETEAKMGKDVLPKPIMLTEEMIKRFSSNSANKIKDATKESSLAQMVIEKTMDIVNTIVGEENVEPEQSMVEQSGNVEAAIEEPTFDFSVGDATPAEFDVNAENVDIVEPFDMDVQDEQVAEISNEDLPFDFDAISADLPKPEEENFDNNIVNQAEEVAVDDNVFDFSGIENSEVQEEVSNNVANEESYTNVESQEEIPTDNYASVYKNEIDQQNSLDNNDSSIEHIKKLSSIVNGHNERKAAFAANKNAQEMLIEQYENNIVECKNNIEKINTEEAAEDLMYENALKQLDSIANLLNINNFDKGEERRIK